MGQDTFTFHANITEECGLHQPKLHALRHALGGADELNIATMAFDSTGSSEIKTYIDSQIAGENHWDMNSGNTEISPHIIDIDVNLNAGSLITTGDGIFANLETTVGGLKLVNGGFIRPDIDTATALGFIKADDSTVLLNINTLTGEFDFQANNLVTTGAITAGTFTDGTATLTGGALTGVTGGIQLDADNAKLYFGAGDDASVTYDGTDFRINSHESGSGSIVLDAGTTKVGKTTGGDSSSYPLEVYNTGGDKIFSIYNVDAVGSNYPYFYMGDPNTSLNPIFYTKATYSSTRDTAKGTIGFNNGNYLLTRMQGVVSDWNGGGMRIKTLKANSETTTLDLIDGYVHLPIDSEKLYFGAAKDASIYYDGTDLVIKPDEVGTGAVKTVAGRIVNTTRVTTTYQILVTDHVIYCDTDNGAFTVTLPAGVLGTKYRIANTGTSDKELTITPSGTELLLNENDTFILNDGDVLEIVYDTTEGWI